MRLLSLIVAFAVSGALAVYVLTCSVNDAPPVPVHPIVGKWHREMMDGLPVPAGSEAVGEFSAEGRFVWERVNNDSPNRHVGTYTIDQDVLDIVSDPGQEHGLPAGRDRRVYMNFSPCRNRMEIRAYSGHRKDVYIRADN